MPSYSQQEVDRARQPLRSDLDRGDAVCVLGHLLTEQREAHSDDRATIIRSITSAVQDFDTRTALGAPAARFNGSGGVPAVASTPAPPAPTAPAAAVASAPASTRASGALVASASMRRELQRQGLTASAERTGGVDLLGGQRSAAIGNAGPTALATSMERELKRQGLTTRGRG